MSETFFLICTNCDSNLCRLADGDNRRWFIYSSTTMMLMLMMVKKTYTHTHTHTHTLSHRLAQRHRLNYGDTGTDIDTDRVVPTVPHTFVNESDLSYKWYSGSAYMQTHSPTYSPIHSTIVSFTQAAIKQTYIYIYIYFTKHSCIMVQQSQDSTNWYVQ